MFLIIRKYVSQTTAGFTLVELLVVFFVLALVAAISFAGFLQFSRKEAEKSAVSDVRQMLSVARSYAQTQMVTPQHCLNAGQCQCQSGQPFGGYQVLFCCGNQQGGVSALCPQFPPNNCISGDTKEHYELDLLCGSNKYAIDSKRFPAQVSVNNSGSTTRAFLFAPLTGTVNAGTISISGFSQTDSIGVSAIGVIQ